jgi:hypothetical protein
VKRWLEQYACSVLSSIHVEPMRVRIMSMVFGVESLKKNGMQPVIGSSHQLAFAQFLNASSPLSRVHVGTV